MIPVEEIISVVRAIINGGKRMSERRKADSLTTLTRALQEGVQIRSDLIQKMVDSELEELEMSSKYGKTEAYSPSSNKFLTTLPVSPPPLRNMPMADDSDNEYLINMMRDVADQQRRSCSKIDNLIAEVKALRHTAGL